MIGLVNRAIECFLRDTYGDDVWLAITQAGDLGFDSFEGMLVYPDVLTEELIETACEKLCKSRDELLEDLGTYLVSHENTEALRRLMRFGGVTFVEFLHSLDDLPDRARLAVPDLDLPDLELVDEAPGRFTLTCRSDRAGFGTVLSGLLRAMADDYGALVLIDRETTASGAEVLDITVHETAFAEGRTFTLGASG